MKVSAGAMVLIGITLSYAIRTVPHPITYQGPLSSGQSLLKPAMLFRHGQYITVRAKQVNFLSDCIFGTRICYLPDLLPEAACLASS